MVEQVRGVRGTDPAAGHRSGDRDGTPERGLRRALRRRMDLDAAIADRRRAAARELRTIVGDLTRGTSGRPPADSGELLRLVVEMAGELAMRAHEGDRECAESMRAIARWLVSTDLPEVEAIASRSTETGAGNAAEGPAGPPASVTASGLLACVRGHSADPDEIIAVGDLRRLAGGFSKEMLAATVEHARGSQEIVIRKVAPGRTAGTLGGEYATLRFAWEHGVPVPQPLWLDETALGTPAFATTMVAGRPLGDVWGPTERIGRPAVRAAATSLARLHSLDVAVPPRTPLPPMLTPGQILAAIDERRSVIDAAAGEVTAPFVPLFALVCAWLRAGVPRGVGRPVLVHGDYGLHNLLFDGDRLSAVLDWERAHLGHAAEDLTYMQPSIEAVGLWEDFLDAYRGAGGPALDAERLSYYPVWHDLWRGVSSYRIRARYLAAPERITDAMAGLLMAPRFLLNAARIAFAL
ncbi:phosphotransferase [Actinomadura sp. LD22]|uniref:Phosphotransferase n=1 Tax=Actinomadura physcomitrii TaxID=2650748 RepID=A0A6I4MAE0_9ACTN|nr:phosphotransferase family protein [Actinomadura physcomitrii]MWA03208.1 phosphotransferase [Actinomadura physcomitrii]